MSRNFYRTMAFARFRNITRCIDRVTGVSLMEFGTPEAMWHLDVTDFPAIVTMDAHGNSLHKDVEQASGVRLQMAGG